MITTVTEKNQVTIPVELANELGIKVGPHLEWHKGGKGELQAKPHCEAVAIWPAA